MEGKKKMVFIWIARKNFSTDSRQQIAALSARKVDEGQHVANYSCAGTYSKAIAVTHRPEWATCGYFISWARWFIARPVIFHPASYWNEVIDCAAKEHRRNAGGGAEFLFIAATFARMKGCCHQSARGIAYLLRTVDLMHRRSYRSSCAKPKRKLGRQKSIIRREFDCSEQSRWLKYLFLFPSFLLPSDGVGND